MQKSSLDILRHQKGFDVKAPKDCKEKLKLRLSSSQVTMDTGEHVSWSGTRLGGKVQGGGAGQMKSAACGGVDLVAENQPERISGY